MDDTVYPWKILIRSLSVNQLGRENTENLVAPESAGQPR